MDSAHACTSLETAVFQKIQSDKNFISNNVFLFINLYPDWRSRGYTLLLMQKSYMTTGYTRHRFELGECFIARVKLLNIPTATLQTNYIACFLLCVSTWHQIKLPTLPPSIWSRCERTVRWYNQRYVSMPTMQCSICKPFMLYCRAWSYIYFFFLFFPHIMHTAAHCHHGHYGLSDCMSATVRKCIVTMKY